MVTGSEVKKKIDLATFTYGTCTVSRCRGSGLFLKLHPVQ